MIALTDGQGLIVNGASYGKASSGVVVNLWEEGEVTANDHL